MEYSVWAYNNNPHVKFGISDILIWSRSRFDPVSENLSNCNVWGFPTYCLEPKLHNPGAKIHNLDPMI